MLHNNLPDILHISSILLAFIGLYFVIRVWLKWKNIDIEVLKAKVFLNKKFLERNWMYVFLAGSSMTGHQAIGLLFSYGGIDRAGLLFQISEILEFSSLAFIVILAYEWFKVLHHIK